MELTDKQKRFCQEYVIDMNGTQAAIRAGYDRDSARATASRLLAMDEISACVNDLQGAISERLNVSSEKVVQELAKLAFADVRDYLEPTGEIKNLTSIDPEKTCAIESLRVTKTEWPGGSKTLTQLKIHSKLKALDKLGIHLGVFDKAVNACSELPLVIVPGDDL